MPALRSTLRTYPAATLGLLVLFLIAGTAWVRDTHDRLDEMFYGEQYVFPTFDVSVFTFQVDSMRPSAEAAGLRKGDLLLEVNGRPVNGFADYNGSVRNARAGDRLRVRIRRITPAGSQEHELSIPLRPFTYVGYDKSSPAYWCLLALRITTPFLCLVLGFWVVAVRIYDRAAWTLLIILLSVANLITEGRTLFGNQDALQPFLTWFSFAAIMLGPVALAYFGITFPETLAFDRHHPWVKWILLGPMLARAAFMSVVSGLFLHHHALTLKLQNAFQVIAASGSALEAIAISAFFLSLFYKTAKAADQDARRRLLLLDTAAVPACYPSWSSSSFAAYEG